MEVSCQFHATAALPPGKEAPIPIVYVTELPVIFRPAWECRLRREHCTADVGIATSAAEERKDEKGPVTFRH
jgi:hypothetical protein